MSKKNPVQSMTPDPEVDGGSSVMKDLAGPAALAGLATAYGFSSAKEREERAKKFKEERESRAAARENMKKYGMKKGGKVGSASSRADGIAQRGKTKGKMV
jgi:hypothetical protein